MAKKPNTATVAVDIYTDAIKTHIEERLAETLEAKFSNDLHNLIVERVHELVDAVTRKQVEKAVADAIAEGWQTTNSYGEPTGVKLTLKGRIAEYLTKPEGDYNKRTTRVDKIIAETVDAAFRGEFDKELRAAKERLKAQLDATIATKFVETIKSALGLR